MVRALSNIYTKTPYEAKETLEDVIPLKLSGWLFRSYTGT